ncbi:MAG: hypothetical protein SH847_01615 [Roseiflexaceae bacterium]|nr:hypothetical protein [Roseiflexaceae bacterium]
MSNTTTFQGNPAQRALAEQVYQVMTTQGRLFASDAPIRQTLTNLADFFAVQNKTDRETIARDIDAALRENNGLFAREEREDDILYITSRVGAYKPRVEDTLHMFRRRLHEPEHPLPVDDISVVVTTTRPALTTVEPVFISDYWQQQAGGTPVVPALPTITAAVVVPDDVETVVEAIEVAEEAPIIAPVPVAAPAVVERPMLNTVITLPNGLQIDLRRSVDELMAQYGATLATQLRSSIERAIPPRLVVFGNQVFPEVGGGGFGKNDLRRIRDYLLEAGEPLLDVQIMQDIFRYSQNRPDYESFRFELNYRLSREKDFEFVGVEGARLWTTKGMPPIGTKRLKASEMGQVMGYIEEGFDDSLVSQTADTIRKSGSLSLILSFFEWEYGALPFTRAMAALMPTSLLPDQRTTVLRFEAPQHYTSALVELRYPTGNRGGWLQGLDGFFRDYLIPGAMITISRTDNQHIFTITYEEQPEVADRLLVVDEKKNKLAFENVSYYCVVDTDMLLSQAQYGRLRNLKLFPMGERRKGDAMLEHAFETIGDPIGTRSEPRYRTTIEKLLVALNVLRPASKDYLVHLLKENELFVPETATTWTYTPPPATDEDDEDEEDIYDDDEE